MNFAIEESDRYVLPIAGKNVSRLMIDYAFWLVFGDASPDIKLRIGGKCILLMGARETICDPSNVASLSPLLGLFGQIASAGSAFKDGRLEVEFEGGIQLKVPLGTRYEPWELASEDGLKLVSIPGGDIAFWQSHQK